MSNRTTRLEGALYPQNDLLYVSLHVTFICKENIVSPACLQKWRILNEKQQLNYIKTSIYKVSHSLCSIIQVSFAQLYAYYFPNTHIFAKTLLLKTLVHNQSCAQTSSVPGQARSFELCSVKCRRSV